jgi:hypothetical protein
MRDERRRFHYAELVLDTLKHLGAFRDLIPQPVDVEVIPNFDGAAAPRSSQREGWALTALPRVPNP